MQEDESAATLLSNKVEGDDDVLRLFPFLAIFGEEKAGARREERI